MHVICLRNKVNKSWILELSIPEIWNLKPGFEFKSDGKQLRPKS
jgi:hypothetical protein